MGPSSRTQSIVKPPDRQGDSGIDTGVRGGPDPEAIDTETIPVTIDN
jgi:hypothetical protein